MMDITISLQLIGLRTNWKENKWVSWVSWIVYLIWMKGECYRVHRGSSFTFSVRSPISRSLFLANLIYGSKGGYHSGIKIALGHTIVELPLIIILALSIFEYSSFTLTEECLRMIGFDRRDCNNNIFSSTNKQYHKKTRNYWRHPQQA